VGRIPEYYKPGDDKLIFAKRLAAPEAGNVAAAGDSAKTQTTVAKSDSVVSVS
jgi:hypothetical protein